MFNNNDKTEISEFLIFKVILLGITCILGVYGQDAGYCDPDLCTDYLGRVSDHIGCPGVAKDECPKGARWIQIDKELREIVLDKHNSYRNSLAGGKVAGFPSAKRMPTIVCEEISFFFYRFIDFIFLNF